MGKLQGYVIYNQEGQMMESDRACLDKSAYPHRKIYYLASDIDPILETLNLKVGVGEAAILAADEYKKQLESAREVILTTAQGECRCGDELTICVACMASKWTKENDS